MTDQLISNTRHPVRHPWPQDCYVQGGERGVVFSRDGRNNYATAFVEAFPGSTFLRGEGTTIEEAEDVAWEQFLRWRDCDGTGQGHGPYERRKYRNGAGFCTRCGIWMNRVLDPLPEEPDRAPSVLEKALTGDAEAAGLILDGLQRTKEQSKGSNS